MRTLSLAVLAVTLVSGNALAQTAAEQRAILRGFERAVWAYVQQLDCSEAEAQLTDPSEPVLFTLPVSMVFRQLIASTLGHGQVPTMSAPPGRPEHLMAHDAFPIEKSSPLPDKLIAVLPVLPPGLEYRFVERDLVLLDTELKLVVGVLRDAIGRAHTFTQDNQGGSR
jgi:hypothetical protein